MLPTPSIHMYASQLHALVYLDVLLLLTSISKHVSKIFLVKNILGFFSKRAFNYQIFLARYLENMKPKIHASCMGVELDYPLGQDDACDGFINTQCPIVANEKVNYRYALTIPAIFPEVSVVR